MGDPAGVGPEIIAASWPHFFAGGADSPDRIRPCRPVVFGHPEIIRRAVALRKTNAFVQEITSLTELSGLMTGRSNCIPVMNCCDSSVLLAPTGQIDARSGEAAFASLSRAIDFAVDKKVDAIVTAPLNKKSLNLAGHAFPGHTEILASRCKVDDYAMMLYLGPQPSIVSPTGLAVVHVTLHTAMKNVFGQITKESVREKCHLIRDFMRKIKGGEPAIGVCALNCHNGEEGLFGTEEIDIIRPAVAQAKREGLNVAGPFPSDTLMLAAKNGIYDGIVAMIHDQGHIAVKLLDMHHAVNITLGLPIIRTSVAHGTAFDVAWQGTAQITSMLEAVRVAEILVRS